MIEVGQEERRTLFENLSREIGCLGVSLLHRLNALYGSDVLEDVVFDYKALQTTSMFGLVWFSFSSVSSGNQNTSSDIT